MDKAFFEEFKYEMIIPIRKKPNMKIKWGAIQNKEYDKRTNPFSIYRFNQLIDYIMNKLTDNYERDYCFCRWWRCWGAMCDEYCFCSKGKAVPNPNKKDKMWDFKFNNVGGLNTEFDLKSTRIPNKFTDKERDYYINNPEELIKWYYEEQSTQSRYGLQNKLYLVHIADNQCEENMLRVDFDRKQEVIDNYFKRIESGEHRPYHLDIGDCVVDSDILFV